MTNPDPLTAKSTPAGTIKMTCAAPEALTALAEALGAVSGGPGPLALLYGGSVSEENAAELLADPHTDGVFVGRAAWTPAGLLAIVGIAAEHAAARWHL